MNTISKEPERHEIEALLPWHAAGTLSRRDADRVQQALAGDRELTRRYDLVRRSVCVIRGISTPFSTKPLSPRATSSATRRPGMSIS
jgi:hypothetical protein